MSDSAEAKRRQQQKQEWLLRVVLIIAAAGALYLNLKRSLDEHRAHEASIKNAPKT